VLFECDGEFAYLISSIFTIFNRSPTAPLIPPTSPTSVNATSPGENSVISSHSPSSPMHRRLKRAPRCTRERCPISQREHRQKRPERRWGRWRVFSPPLGFHDNSDISVHHTARSANNINASGGVNGGIPTNGVTTANGSEPQMIKANKGMILRKVGFSFFLWDCGRTRLYLHLSTSVLCC